MKGKDPLIARLAQDPLDVFGAQRLRYRVFVEEMGGAGLGVDHSARRESDAFDTLCDHLILVDPNRDPNTRDHVVGAYRLLPGDRAKEAGGFYSETEFDLAALHATDRKLLELGRSCLDPAHRGGTALMRLWEALGAYVAQSDTEILFGVASFHGTDADALAAPLSFLHHRHLAPPPLRVRSRAHVAMDRVPEPILDRVSAARQIPALLKSYLRLGGYVGDGAFVDHDFNTTDVCLVLDVAQIPAEQRARYGRS